LSILNITLVYGSQLNFFTSSSFICMELGHLLTGSGLTYPEVPSKVYHDSFCQLGSSVSLPWITGGKETTGET